LIELSGVSKTYDNVSALSDIDLRIEKGEIFTVLGPNGSGKTTLLKILGGLEKPTKGIILYKNKRITEKYSEEIRRTTTLVFQHAILFKGSVRNNVEFGLRIRGLPDSKINEKVNQALTLVGLLDMADKSAKELSGGEKQRCSLARALVLESELLLLDEPTLNLDPESLNIIKQVIRRLNKKGVTIVLATHDLEQAKELSQRIILLDRGKIVESGSPILLLNSQSTEMVKFTRSENFFTGQSQVKSGVSIVDIGNDVKIHGAFSKEGGVNIYIRPEDIIISNEKIISSARNNLLGTITKIEDNDSIIKMNVNVGVLFIVQITRKSFEEMGLNVGQEIYLTFKASSVRFV
jgi:molybdopterin-binding protein